MIEIWKKISDYNNYDVSNMGRVRRSKCTLINKNGISSNYNEKILKQEDVKGYLRVTLSSGNVQKRIFVHRLVASHFLDNEHSKPCVNHLDGNKKNNKLSNLEWCTYSENETHSYNTLSKINVNRKLSVDDVKDIRDNCIKKVNTDFFMNKYNVCRKTVLNVLNNKYYV